MLTLVLSIGDERGPGWRS